MSDVVYISDNEETQDETQDESIPEPDPVQESSGLFQDGELNIDKQFISRPIDIQLDNGLHPAVQAMAKFMEDSLFEWATVTPNIPASHFKTKIPKLNLLDIPSVKFEEGMEKLNDIQREQLRKTATFKVPSKVFAGKSYIWRISAFLQSGEESINKNWYSSLARSADRIFYDVPNEFKQFGNLFDEWTQVGRNLLDAIVGMGQYIYPNQDSILEDLRLRYFMSNMIPDEQFFKLLESVHERKDGKPNAEEVASNLESRLTDLTWRVSRTAAVVEAGILCRNHPDAKVASRIISQAVEEWKAREQEVFEALLQEVTGALDPSKSISQDILNDVANQTFEKQLVYVTSQLREDTQATTYTTTLANYLEARFAVEKLQKLHNEVQAQKIQKVKEALKASHPKRFYSAKWVLKHSQQATADFTDTVANHKEVFTTPQEQSLVEQSLELNKLFTKEIVKANFGKLWKYRGRESPFHIKIWDSKKWKLVNNQYRTEDVFVVNTDRPGWRLSLLLARMRTYFWNWLFFLLLRLRGSIYMLVMPSTFTYRMTVVYVNGRYDGVKIAPLRFDSILQKVRNAWAAVAKSRQQFESQPDYGLIPKTFSRIVHCIWNYGFRGGLTTILILVFLPPFYFLCAVLCAVLLVLTPIWSVLSPLLAYLLDLIIYDKHGLRVSPILWSLASLGGTVIGQALCLARIPLHGLVCSVDVGFNAIRKVVRTGYDKLIMCTLMKRARVPRMDSFLAKRIAGPGLSANFFYTVDVDEILIVLRMHLENIELQLFEEETYKRIQLPLKKLYDFIARNGKYLGMGANSSTNLIERLSRAEKMNSKSLNAKLSKRKFAEINRVRSNAGKIRLSKEKLGELLKRSEELVEMVVEQRILPMLEEGSTLPAAEVRARFFERYECKVNHWRKLSYNYIQYLFGEGILQPLEDTDDAFSLGFDKVTITEYAKCSLETGVTPDSDLERSRVKLRTFSPYIHQTVRASLALDFESPPLATATLWPIFPADCLRICGFFSKRRVKGITTPPLLSGVVASDILSEKMKDMERESFR